MLISLSCVNAIVFLGFRRNLKIWVDNEFLYDIG